MAILEGCGQVADVQKMKLYQISFGALFIWIVILSDGNLFAASSLAITNFTVSILWILVKYKGLLNQLKSNKYVIKDLPDPMEKRTFTDAMENCIKLDKRLSCLSTFYTTFI